MCQADCRGPVQSRQGIAAGHFSKRSHGDREAATMSTHQISDADYAAALSAGQENSENEVRAQAVRYVPERDAIEIVTNRNAGLLIPRQWIGVLQDVSP